MLPASFYSVNVIHINILSLWWPRSYSVPMQSCLCHGLLPGITQGPGGEVVKELESLTAVLACLSHEVGDVVVQFVHTEGTFKSPRDACVGQAQLYADHVQLPRWVTSNGGEWA